MTTVKYDPKELAVYLLRQIAEYDANKSGPCLIRSSRIKDNHQNLIDTRSVNQAIRWLLNQGLATTDSPPSADDSDDEDWYRHFWLTDRGRQKLTEDPS